MKKVAECDELSLIIETCWIGNARVDNKFVLVAIALLLKCLEPETRSRLLLLWESCWRIRYAIRESLERIFSVAIFRNTSQFPKKKKRLQSSQCDSTKIKTLITTLRNITDAWVTLVVTKNVFRGFLSICGGGEKFWMEKKFQEDSATIAATKFRVWWENTPTIYVSRHDNEPE